MKYSVVHTSTGLKSVPSTSVSIIEQDVWFEGSKEECEDYILDMYTVDCSDIDSYVEPMDN